ncbi:MAG: heterodisulfide reductase, subunit B [Candidatus Heimdallarchaeota archaeon]|nr:heterodisulfide reductase, subunit B [Candidatus Heimdallarchaeota archaeon]MCK4769679.1 heterodisulfide reductase, subunit B [Candidatus Heimdallarchaeota archaeon]
MVQYSYFPGCNLKTNAKGFGETAIAVSKKLNSELVEIPNWNCCGTVHTMTTDNLMKRIAPVRVLARSKSHLEDLEDSSNHVITLCSMCNSTLKIVNEEVKENPDDLETINFQLEEDDETYSSDMEVKHFLEVLRDVIGFEKIRSNVVKPLEGLKVSPYYGCMLLHPEVAKIDDVDMPTVLEDLMESLGAEAIFSPLFKYCCGSYHIVDEEEIVTGQVEKIVEAARVRGANALAVACPLCAYNIDQQQKVIAEKTGRKDTLPVFYFSQLMAIAFGESLKINHFEDHKIDPRILLEELKLL